jgi:ATP-dependent Clp protease ATP-binding subunit ClpA
MTNAQAKFLRPLRGPYSRGNATIELTDEAREWLVKNGYDEAMGARPMARVIQARIKTPLADGSVGRHQGVRVVNVILTAGETRAKKLSFVYPEGPHNRGVSVSVI